MYDFFKDFAGPIATALAAIAAVFVTAYFAWHQKKIAEEKLRLDLFERRWAIFNSIFDFYEAMISWKGTPEQIAARARFFRAYQESGFLFRKESEIEAILKNLNDAGMKVIGFKENTEHFKSDTELFLRLFSEVQDIQTNVFSNGLDQLKSAMPEYLDFHYVRPRRSLRLDGPLSRTMTKWFGGNKRP